MDLFEIVLLCVIPQNESLFDFGVCALNYIIIGAKTWPNTIIFSWFLIKNLSKRFHITTGRFCMAIFEIIIQMESCDGIIGF